MYYVLYFNKTSNSSSTLKWLSFYYPLNVILPTLAVYICIIQGSLLGKIYLFYYMDNCYLHIFKQKYK